MDPFPQQPSHVLSDSSTVRQDLIQSPETMATVARAIIVGKYGEEAYLWDPLTVSLELKADFKADPCPEFMDRWNAMQVLMTGDAFFRRIDAFFAVCNAFSSGEPMFGAFDPVTVDEAAWAVAEAGMNRDMLEFSPTIRAYCRKILELDGFGEDSYPPAFEPVFGGAVKLKDIKAGLVSDGNGASLKAYLMDNMNDVAKQLDSMPDMEGIDIDTLRGGMLSAIVDRRIKGHGKQG